MQYAYIHLSIRSNKTWTEQIKTPDNVKLVAKVAHTQCIGSLAVLMLTKRKKPLDKEPRKEKK